MNPATVKAKTPRMASVVPRMVRNHRLTDLSSAGGPRADQRGTNDMLALATEGVRLFRAVGVIRTSADRIAEETRARRADQHADMSRSRRLYDTHPRVRHWFVD